MTESIKNKICYFLKKHDLLKPNAVFLVGFSGGIDSLCLLDVLYNLSKELNFSIIAAHLNHNWRGEESKIEENNAKAYCIQRNITFCSETLPEDIPHTELEARNKRYAFFNRVSENFKITAILTGHTLTDQVETVLYRIIKGTGLNGLKGIPEVRQQEDNPDIYRPILYLTRQETYDYCKENNLTPNHDSSNLNQDYLRNRIRLSLIPELKTYNSKAENAILRLSAVASESEEIISEYMSHITPMICNDNKEIRSQEFLELSKSVQKRIVINLLNENNIDYDFEKINEIITFIQNCKSLKSGNTLSLTTGAWLFASSQIIKIINHIKSDVLKFSLLVEKNKENFHPELNKTIKITQWDEDKPQKFPSESSNIIYVDLSSTGETLYLRTRQPGDRIQPFGINEKIKLKKYFINKGTPEFMRNNIPLLTTDTEVLWAVGVGMSELLRVNDKPTHKIEIY